MPKPTSRASEQAIAGQHGLRLARIEPGGKDQAGKGLISTQGGGSIDPSLAALGKMSDRPPPCGEHLHTHRTLRGRPDKVGKLRAYTMLDSHVLEHGFVGAEGRITLGAAMAKNLWWSNGRWSHGRARDCWWCCSGNKTCRVADRQPVTMQADRVDESLPLARVVDHDILPSSCMLCRRSQAVGLAGEQCVHGQEVVRDVATPSQLATRSATFHL